MTQLGNTSKAFFAELASMKVSCPEGFDLLAEGIGLGFVSSVLPCCCQGSGDTTKRFGLAGAKPVFQVEGKMEAFIQETVLFRNSLAEESSWLAEEAFIGEAFEIPVFNRIPLDSSPFGVTWMASP